MRHRKLGAVKGRHQSVPLQGELRQSVTGHVHPDLAAMMKEDAATSGVTIGWIINDALAAYYRSPELASTTLYWQRHKQQLPPSVVTPKTPK